MANSKAPTNPIQTNQPTIGQKPNPIQNVNSPGVQGNANKGGVLNLPNNQFGNLPNLSKNPNDQVNSFITPNNVPGKPNLPNGQTQPGASPQLPNNIGQQQASPNKNPIGQQINLNNIQNSPNNMNQASPQKPNQLPNNSGQPQNINSTPNKNPNGQPININNGQSPQGLQNQGSPQYPNKNPLDQNSSPGANKSNFGNQGNQGNTYGGSPQLQGNTNYGTMSSSPTKDQGKQDVQHQPGQQSLQGNSYQPEHGAAGLYNPHVDLAIGKSEE